MDQDLRDVLALLEPDILKALTAIKALVDAITVTDMPAPYRLARPDPDDVAV